MIRICFLCQVDVDVADWQKNGAGLWHSHKHGFGLMNAWRLTNAARVRSQTSQLAHAVDIFHNIFFNLNRILCCDHRWNRLNETIPMNGHNIEFESIDIHQHCQGKSANITNGTAIVNNVYSKHFL